MTSKLHQLLLVYTTLLIIDPIFLFIRFLFNNLFRNSILTSPSINPKNIKNLLSSYLIPKIHDAAITSKEAQGCQWIKGRQRGTRAPHLISTHTLSKTIYKTSIVICLIITAPSITTHPIRLLNSKAIMVVTSVNILMSKRWLNPNTISWCTLVNIILSRNMLLLLNLLMSEKLLLTLWMVFGCLRNSIRLRCYLLPYRLINTCFSSI